MDFSTGLTRFQVGSLLDDDSGGSAIKSFGSDGPSLRRRRRSQSDTDTTQTEALPAAFVSNWTKLKSSKLSPKFYSRLLRLASGRFGTTTVAPSNERKLRPSSLSDFLEFWSQIKGEAVEPDVSLSNDGSISVEWFKSNDQRLDIKFAEETVMFGLLNSGKILEGAESKELVALILRSHSAKPFRWRAKN